MNLNVVDSTSFGLGIILLLAHMIVADVEAERQGHWDFSVLDCRGYEGMENVTLPRFSGVKK